MKKTFLLVASCLMLVCASRTADAAFITFEGFAPSGGGVNVNPLNPYSEAGFTFTPTNDESAVFDSADIRKMIGNDSDWFGFAENNIITLTNDAGNPFSLLSFLLGPSTIGSGTSSTTIVGQLAGGGILSATYSGLTTAALVSPNWNNLTSVTFRTTDDSGIDNIQFAEQSAVPEPGTLALLSLGGIGLAAGKFRKRRVATAA